MSSAAREDFLERVRRAEAHARRVGALQPIATHGRVLEWRGLRVLVRVLEHARRKALARRKQRDGRAPEDPFLPYEQDLLVQELGPHHVALLNKFPVLDHHVLVVTRRFEHQESPLTEADFAALWQLMGRAGGLGFYNAGEAAGASQQHKHLQWVPTPLDPAGAGEIPFAPRITEAALATGTVEEFPFRHALGPVPGIRGAGQPRALLESYRELLGRVGLRPLPDGRLPPYNLLLTRGWMMLVPRSREHWEGISVNALGFSGAFLVRDDSEFEALTARGPMAVLRAVARPPAAD